MGGGGGAAVGVSDGAGMRVGTRATSISNGAAVAAIAATAVPPIFIAVPAPDGMVVDATATASWSDDGPLSGVPILSPSHQAPTATATIAAAKSHSRPAGLRKTRLQLRQRHL